MKNYKLKLNSLEKIEELLQEMYNEINKIINEAQQQINKISTSVQLNNEGMDAKAKYAKAMNDFISTKDKALNKKLDIAKLMAEIWKHNGNMKAVVEEADLDWGNVRDAVYENAPEEQQDEVVRYSIK